MFIQINLKVSSTNNDQTTTAKTISQFFFLQFFFHSSYFSSNEKPLSEMSTFTFLLSKNCLKFAGMERFYHPNAKEIQFPRLFISNKSNSFYAQGFLVFFYFWLICVCWIFSLFIFVFLWSFFAKSFMNFGYF